VWKDREKEKEAEEDAEKKDGRTTRLENWPIVDS
jgi:hypothetical protein